MMRTQLYKNCLFELQNSNKRIAVESLIGQLRKCGKNPKIHSTVIIEQPNSVEIGNDVAIGSFVHIWGGGGIYIGDGAMIASHVTITSLTHDHSCEVMRDTLIATAVRIEAEAWIGTHAVILPGITIGYGAVVGAGAVVTHDIPTGMIVGGVPARHQRMRVVHVNDEDRDVKTKK